MRNRLSTSSHAGSISEIAHVVRLSTIGLLRLLLEFIVVMVVIVGVAANYVCVVVLMKGILKLLKTVLQIPTATTMPLRLDLLV